RDLAAIQEDGKAGRLKPWKPGSTIYCRAGFERPLQKSLSSTRCKLSIRIDIFLCDRHPTADAERAACHFQSRRGLLPFVLVEIDASLDPAHRLFVKSMGDNVARTEILFYIVAHDFIENFIGRKGTLVFLIRL